MKKLILAAFFLGTGICMADPVDSQEVILQNGTKIIINQKIYYKATASEISSLVASKLCFLVGAIQFLRGTYKILASDTGTYKKSLADFDEAAIKAMSPKQLEKLLDQEDENRLAKFENLKTYLNSAIWLGVGGLFYMYGWSGRDAALADPKIATPADPKALNFFEYLKEIEKTSKF